MVFISARKGPPNIGDPDGLFTVQYFDENGNMLIRSGGSRAWRCNNPGNLLKGPYSMGKDRRAIGFAGDNDDEYAVYPEYNVGHEALIVMLKGSKYSPLTLSAAIKRYDRKNLKYIDTVVQITGLDPNRTIKSLNNSEFEQFWKSIESIEKWNVGREDFIERWYISGVHKKRGIITEYLIDKNNQSKWISKKVAIDLAKEHYLHATLVYLKNGTMYLRPEYGLEAFRRVI